MAKELPTGKDQDQNLFSLNMKLRPDGKEFCTPIGSDGIFIYSTLTQMLDGDSEPPLKHLADHYFKVCMYSRSPTTTYEIEIVGHKQSQKYRLETLQDVHKLSNSNRDCFVPLLCTKLEHESFVRIDSRTSLPYVLVKIKSKNKKPTSSDDCQAEQRQTIVKIKVGNTVASSSSDADTQAQETPDQQLQIITIPQ